MRCIKYCSNRSIRWGICSMHQTQNRRMSQHKLGKLFEPQSVAVVGASEREGSLGRAVWKRLRAHPYAGRAYAVNPKREVFGEPCYAKMTDLPERVDLALIAAPAAACASILRECGASGCNYVLMLSHGFGSGTSAADLEAAQKLCRHCPRCPGADGRA